MFSVASVYNANYSETSQQRTKHLVSNVTIFFKLPPNSGHLSITDKFFMTRSCPLSEASQYHNNSQRTITRSRLIIDTLSQQTHDIASTSIIRLYDVADVVQTSYRDVKTTSCVYQDGVVLVSLLLTLIIFDTLIYCFCC